MLLLYAAAVAFWCWRVQPRRGLRGCTWCGHSPDGAVGGGNVAPLLVLASLGRDPLCQAEMVQELTFSLVAFVEMVSGSLLSLFSFPLPSLAPSPPHFLPSLPSLPKGKRCSSLLSPLFSLLSPMSLGGA